MNKKILASATMFALVLAYVLPFSIDARNVPEVSAAMSDYYLKLDGIDGEVVDRGHENGMRISSWSFGASNPTSVGSGGMSAGKVNFQDMSVMKSVDKATPALFKVCASGKRIAKAELSVVKPSATGVGLTFMKYTLTDLTCTSFKNSADPLTESLSFNYAKIEMSYTPMTSDGTAGKPVTASWDLKANKAF